MFYPEEFVSYLEVIKQEFHTKVIFILRICLFVYLLLFTHFIAIKRLETNSEFLPPSHWIIGAIAIGQPNNNGLESLANCYLIGLIANALIQDCSISK